MMSGGGMIWWVSILMRRSGGEMPVTLTSCSMAPSSAQDLARVSDAPGGRRCGDRRRARQMRSCLRPLPAFEIAVRRAGDALVLQPVITHMAARGAPTFMPLGPGILETPIV